MRIITGYNKGRKLESLPGKLVRPTSEKVKEAVFSMLQTQIPGSIFCDLFAGTGAMGLEALSRGADFCYFGDHAQESIQVIRANIAHCKEEESSVLIHGDFLKTLSAIDGQVDIFFLDPPYKKNALEEAVEAIAKGDLLAEDGWIVCEHGRDKELPETLYGFTKIKEKKYGTVVISVYTA